MDEQDWRMLRPFTIDNNEFEEEMVCGRVLPSYLIIGEQGWWVVRPHPPLTTTDLRKEGMVWGTSAVVRCSCLPKTLTVAGQPIATRITGDPETGNNGLFYFLVDHLGSTTLMVTTAGVIMSTAYFLPYGGYRYPSTPPPSELTDTGFTGHKHNDSVGLIYMNARYYVPAIGRFLTADTLVPGPANPQAYNRYSYVLGNPLRLVDPSGHGICDPEGNCENQPPPPQPPQNPWALTEDMFDLNGDGMITWREEQEALLYYGSAEFATIAEQILLDSLVPPTDATINPFGGPMTSTNCGVAGRPPCDARHPGVDSSTGETNDGDPIYAAAYGRVVRTGATNPALDGQGATGGFGHYVIVEHDVYGVKFYSIYAHNGTVLVEAGDIVSGGDQIATMGNSGTQTVHLHFEIRKQNNIDWNADNPFQTQVYWPATVTELKANFVDLGSVFDYNTTYEDWAEAHP